MHPDDLEEALVIDDAAYNATHSYAYEMSYRLIAKSGKVVWCVICAAQWSNQGGRTA